jgi:hypothetical protein
MFPSAIGQLKSKEQPRNRFGPTPEMPRRPLNGATAAVENRESVNLYQPQDGATAQRRRVTDIASRLLKLSAGEPEDARLTGGTRSLMRRLSGLNLVQFSRPGMKTRSMKPALTNANVA